MTLKLRDMRHTPVLFVLFLCIGLSSNAQNKLSIPSDHDMGALGLGLGFDYGGIGMNFTVYPQKNIGIFAGGGYALAGFGYNLGLKFRLNPDNRFIPFAMIMYGYNTAIAVSDGGGGFGYNSGNLNKLFYGPTAGVGIDIKSRRAAGYWSFALTIPFRGQDANNYMNELEANNGVSFSNKPSPVGLSIGYRFILF